MTRRLGADAICCIYVGAGGVHRASVVQQQLQQLQTRAAPRQERIPRTHIVRTHPYYRVYGRRSHILRIGNVRFSYIERDSQEQYH